MVHRALRRARHRGGHDSRARAPVVSTACWRATSIATRSSTRASTPTPRTTRSKSLPASGSMFSRFGLTVSAPSLTRTFAAARKEERPHQRSRPPNSQLSQHGGASSTAAPAPRSRPSRGCYGRERLTRALEEYTKHGRFRNPVPEDLIEAVGRAVGPDAARALHQALRRTRDRSTSSRATCRPRRRSSPGRECSISRTGAKPSPGLRCPRTRVGSGASVVLRARRRRAARGGGVHRRERGALATALGRSRPISSLRVARQRAASLRCESTPTRRCCSTATS